MLSQLHHSIESHGTRSMDVVLMLLGCYMLLGVFWGFETCDSGFYLTFYDNIFTNPESVSYNFMYYLSGVLGGALQWLFPTMGLVGMRLAGVALCLAVMKILYSNLKEIVPTSAIMLGFILVVVGYAKPVYAINHDLFTLLFYILAIVWLYRGLTLRKFYYFMLAGLAIGLNCFTRVPNVLSVFIIFIVLISRHYIFVPWRRVAWCVTWYFAGLIMAWASVIALMLVAGHFNIFLANIEELRSIAQDATGEQTPSLSPLIMVQLSFYAMALWTAVKLGGCLVLPAIAHGLSKNKLIIALSWGASFLAMAWFLWRAHSFTVVWVWVLFSGIVVIITQPYELKIWAWLGLFMLLVFPLGSDGAFNNGSIIAFVAAPVASLLWLKRRFVVYFAIFLLACVGHVLIDGPYFDGGNYAVHHATIHADRARGVMTTPYRAHVINNLLKGISPWIKSGDTLMVYGSGSMINYLTHTRPHVGCSWPELLSAEALNYKLSHSKVHPLLLQQKFSTIGEFWGTAAPEHLHQYEQETDFQKNEKLKVLNSYKLKWGYHVVYCDSHFVLYAPASQHL